jgi:hypothetical protein
MATGRVPTTANSPLTAKGDLFGYSTTQARVAVGNDGETLVADSSTSTGLRYTALFGANKNKIINGDFNINQRNFTSLTCSGTDQYGFDRWLGVSNTGTVTYSTQAFTAGAAPVAGYEGTNFARMVTSGQSGTTAYAILSQKIEDVRTFANQTITVSFWAKAASGTPKVAIEMAQGFGSGGSAGVNTYAGQATISTSWARYSVSVAIPSISGKTIGAGSVLSVNIWFSSGTALDSRTGSIGIQTGTFDIWGVQAEAGSVATPFQTATGTIQGELAACQRYYWFVAGGATELALSNFAYFNSTDARGVIQYPQTMRVSPSLISASGTNYFWFEVNGGQDTLNFLGAVRINPQAAVLFNQTNVSGTAGQAGYLVTNNSLASLAFSAEL